MTDRHLHDDLTAIPLDPASLQIHLSLDQPSGQRVALLRNHYASDPIEVSDPRACIDQCNEYIEFTINGCWVCGAERTSPHALTCAAHAQATDEP